MPAYQSNCSRKDGAIVDVEFLFVGEVVWSICPIMVVDLCGCKKSEAKNSSKCWTSSYVQAVSKTESSRPRHDTVTLQLPFQYFQSIIEGVVNGLIIYAIVHLV